MHTTYFLTSSFQSCTVFFGLSPFCFFGFSNRLGIESEVVISALMVGVFDKLASLRLIIVQLGVGDFGLLYIVRKNPEITVSCSMLLKQLFFLCIAAGLLCDATLKRPR